MCTFQTQATQNNATSALFKCTADERCEKFNTFIRRQTIIMMKVRLASWFSRRFEREKEGSANIRTHCAAHMPVYMYELRGGTRCLLNMRAKIHICSINTRRKTILRLLFIKVTTSFAWVLRNMMQLGGVKQVPALSPGPEQCNADQGACRVCLSLAFCGRLKTCNALLKLWLFQQSTREQSFETPTERYIVIIFWAQWTVQNSGTFGGARCVSVCVCASNNLRQSCVT